MRQAETVTFGGSGLDRAQGLRGDPAALEAAWAGARVLALWRGRVCVTGEPEAAALVWIGPDHPVLQGATERILLGRDDGRACFAVDISASHSPQAAAGGSFDATREPHPAFAPDQGFADLRGVMAALSPRQAELAATARALAEWHR
ncbi:MAG: NADH pyrophosphatase, partial [Fuscovulum sp.]|nr:NADH pyrophosphatase [Fuscovulum sp.]